MIRFDRSPHDAARVRRVGVTRPTEPCGGHDFSRNSCSGGCIGEVSETDEKHDDGGETSQELP